MARPEVQSEHVRDDWLPLLDEELSCLPEKYRLPIVLCDLEGRTRQEAADRLGWPEGTVAGRLARARTMLSKRLARRGVILPTGALAVALAPNAASAYVPPALITSTLKAASLLAAGHVANGVISAKVAILTGEVMKAMLLSKLKYVALVLAVGVLGGGSWLAYQSFAKEPAEAVQRAARGGPAEQDRLAVKKPDGEAGAEQPKIRNESEFVRELTKSEHESGALIKLMREPMDMRDFQNPMTLKETLGLLCERIGARGKELPILLDTIAFKVEKVDAANIVKAPDIFDTYVKFQQFPKVMTIALALEVAISQIPETKAQILIRDGIVHITTQKHASLAYLIEERVCASFENQPLVDVVQDIAARNGVSVAVDPRIKEKAQTRLSVTFRNDVTLHAALRIVADMAGLKVVDMQSGLYITTPANAQELKKELRP